MDGWVGEWVGVPSDTILGHSRQSHAKRAGDRVSMSGRDEDEDDDDDDDDEDDDDVCVVRRDRSEKQQPPPSPSPPPPPLSCPSARWRFFREE